MKNSRFYIIVGLMFLTSVLVRLVIDGPHANIYHALFAPSQGTAQWWVTMTRALDSIHYGEYGSAIVLTELLFVILGFAIIGYVQIRESQKLALYRDDIDEIKRTLTLTERNEPLSNIYLKAGYQGKVHLYTVVCQLALVVLAMLYLAPLDSQLPNAILRNDLTVRSCITVLCVMLMAYSIVQNFGKQLALLERVRPFLAITVIIVASLFLNTLALLIISINLIVSALSQLVKNFSVDRRVTNNVIRTSSY